MSSSLWNSRQPDCPAPVPEDGRFLTFLMPCTLSDSQVQRGSSIEQLPGNSNNCRAPRLLQCEKVAEVRALGNAARGENPMGMLGPGLGMAQQQGWSSSRQSSGCGVCLPCPLHGGCSRCAFPVEATAALGKGQFQPAAPKKRDLCVQRHSHEPTTGTGEAGMSIIPRKTGQNNSTGMGALAARSIPRSVRIPEGSMAPGARWLSIPPALGQTGKGAGRNSQPGGSSGRAAHAGREPHSQDLGKHSGAGVVCRFSWIIPGSFPVTPAPPGSSQSALFHLQVAAAAAGAALAPSASSGPSLAALSWPKPSTPMISAQPGDFCFDYFKKGASAASGFRRKDWWR